jgi:hypothetical protein
MTIGQSILNENLSKTYFYENFNPSCLSFPVNDKALFIADKHELIASCKDNALR